VGDGSPGSREAEGESGEGFYIAQSGRCPDLLVIWGGGVRGISGHARSGQTKTAAAGRLANGTGPSAAGGDISRYLQHGRIRAVDVPEYRQGLANTVSRLSVESAKA
jgi:hypothetical protein